MITKTYVVKMAAEGDAIGCHTCEHCGALYDHDEICNECNGGSNWVMRGMH